MTRDYRHFMTKAEALAFIEGIDYVNDSAISVAPEPVRVDGVPEGLWEVTIDDRSSTSLPFDGPRSLTVPRS